MSILVSHPAGSAGRGVAAEVTAATAAVDVCAGGCAADDGAGGALADVAWATSGSLSETALRVEKLTWGYFMLVHVTLLYLLLRLYHIGTYHSITFMNL